MPYSPWKDDDEDDDYLGEGFFDIDDDEPDDEPDEDVRERKLIEKTFSDLKELTNDDDEDEEWEEGFFDIDTDDIVKEPSKEDYERQLDKIPINVIETYIRKKKLDKINKNDTTSKL